MSLAESGEWRNYHKLGQQDDDDERRQKQDEWPDVPNGDNDELMTARITRSARFIKIYFRSPVICIFDYSETITGENYELSEPERNVILRVVDAKIKWHIKDSYKNI